MSITDELRQVAAKTEEANGRCGKLYRGDLDRIADRIDAEHESMVSYWQDASYKDGYDDGFASADDYFTDKRETLEEHGWVKLPVDADGVPIHVGDVVDERLPFGGYAAPAPVDVMELSRGANGYVWMVRLDAANSAFINPKLLRHHHPPTVEDVLEEFAQVYIACNDKGTIAEYAAKLRLAGEGE